jgi:TolB-like protein
MHAGDAFADTAGMPPADAAVLAQLDRVLASPGFANAGRLSRFLRFVVERSLAGDGEQLKEYVIGTEVFDRAADYDPRLDSIVRVEARRLRSKLAEYYEGPGAADPILIRVDKGSYVATFDEPVLPETSAVPSPGPRPAPARGWQRHGWSAAIVTAAVIAIAVLLWREAGRWREDSTVHASSRVSVAILPLVRYDLSPKPGSDPLADAVTDGLIGELARQPGVEVTSRTTVMQYRDVHARLSAVAADLGVQAIVEGRVSLTGERLWIEVRIVDGRRDRKLWVKDFAGTLSDERGLERQVAEAMAAVLTERFQPDGTSP